MARSKFNPVPAPSWLDRYPSDYHDVLSEYGMAPDAHRLAHEFNERLMDLYDSEFDLLIFQSCVGFLHIEIFGEGRDNDGQGGIEDSQ